VRFEKDDLLHLAQTGLFGVVGVLALLLVLRPMVLRLTTLGHAGEGGGAALPSGGAMAALGGPARAALPAAPAPDSAEAVALLEDESMVNIAQVEGQMRASSLRKIGELVEKHPEETLSIVRGWMVQENG